MSTTDTTTETTTTETTETTEKPVDQAALVESLRRQNEDMAAALRNATQSHGVETKTEAAPANRMTLDQQLAALDSDERYMHLGASQKAAIASKLLYDAQIAPEAERLQRGTAANALTLFRLTKSSERDSGKIMELFNQGLAPMKDLSKLEAEDLQKYLDGLWLQAVGMFYRNAQAASAATTPKEEPVNIGARGQGAPVTATTGGTLTIDQVDERTIRLGRQLGWDDARILKTAQRALDNPED